MQSETKFQIFIVVFFILLAISNYYISLIVFYVLMPVILIVCIMTLFVLEVSKNEK